MVAERGNNQGGNRFTDEDLPVASGRPAADRAYLARVRGRRTGGDDHHPNGGNHGDQRRHHKPFVVRLGCTSYVPPARCCWASVSLHQLLLIILHHLLQIIRGNLRAVGVTPVEDQLHGRGLEGVQIAGKISRKTHQQQRFLGIDGGLDRLWAFQQQDMGEGLRPGKALGQLDGMFTVVFVVNRDGGVGHLKRGGKGNRNTG